MRDPPLCFLPVIAKFAINTMGSIYLSNDSHKNDSKSYCSAAMAISLNRISLILGRKLELSIVT